MRSNQSNQWFSLINVSGGLINLVSLISGLISLIGGQRSAVSVIGQCHLLMKIMTDSVNLALQGMTDASKKKRYCI